MTRALKRIVSSLVLLFAAFGALAVFFGGAPSGHFRLLDAQSPAARPPGSYCRLRSLRSMSAAPIHSPVIISQVAPANPAGPVDRRGRPWGWVEIQNVSGRPVDLDGYSLSDRPSNARKWVFPGIVLQPGGRLLLWASGRDELDAPWTLDSSKALDAKDWRVVPETDAAACARVWRNHDPVGKIESLHTEQKLVFPLRVETPSLASVWIQCRADSRRPASLACDFENRTILLQARASSGYRDLNVPNPGRADGYWPLDAGDHELRIGLLGGEARVSRLAVVPREAEFGRGGPDLHLDFRLAAEGEFVGLFSPRGAALDHEDVPALKPGQAYRRASRARGDFEIAEAAPFGLPVTRPPTVKLARRRIEMAPADPADRIHFTLDGSLPTRDSRRYLEPLPLAGNTVLRARAFRDGALPGATADATWWKDRVGALPVLSVIVDPADLDDPERGMLAQRLSRGPMTERPCHVTLITPQGSVRHARAGVRIQGRTSRKYKVKQSLRFTFRSRYGDEAWPGRLFEAPGPEKVTSFVAMGRRLMRNVVAYDVMEAAGLHVPRRRPVMLYVNGRPFGICVLLDDINSPDYLEQAFGHLDLDVIKEKTADNLKWGSRETFDRTWDRLYKAARESLAYVSVEDMAELVDPGYFSRWVATVHYLSLDDAGQGYFVRDRRKAAPAWSFIPWDLDNAFWEMKRPIFLPNRMRGRLFNAMWQSADYRRNLYAAEFQKLLNHRFQQDRWAARVRHYRKLFEPYLGLEYEGLLEQACSEAEGKSEADLAGEFLGFCDHAEEFMATRTDFFFGVLQDKLAVKAHPVRITADRALSVEVDGFETRLPYAGRYLDGSTHRLVLAGPAVLNINGREIHGCEFITNVTEALDIRLR